MKNLEVIAKKIEKKLDEKDSLREKAIKKCREIIRVCRKAMGGMHGGTIKEEELAEACTLQKELKNILKEYPDLSMAGYVEHASQELVEGCCLFAILKDNQLPTPEELDVSYSSYLLGLGDVVGELRRNILDLIKTDEMERAEKIFGKMEKIYSILMRFDYPSGFVPIKKKQDVARQLIERTRGTLLLSGKNWSLEKKLDDLLAMIEKNKQKKKKQKTSSADDDFGLDIDSVWK
jgi:translin